MPENSNTTSTATRIKELTDQLVEYNRQYYQNHTSIISDQEYDLLLKELEELEKDYPNLKLPYSPTQRVGSDKAEGFATVRHVVPMQSLENTYSEPELLQFITNVQKEFPEVSFVTEYKIDGLSISCFYQDGNLVQVSTRGNGEEGDDVTRNAVYIEGIPRKLDFLKAFGSMMHTFEIRGEVFMTYSDFQEANHIRADKKLEPLANPRNAASGTLKTLDPSVFSERKLHALFYHVALADEMPLTQSDMFYAFDKLGIPHAPFFLNKTQAEIVQSIGKIATLRETLPFPTDGAVVKVNEFSHRTRLGQTSKYPRWAKAYKFAAEQAHTTVEGITIQIGRTGVLTPVAELEPVVLAGSVIKRATLHNSDIIRKLDVRVGDSVLIEKAGEVIPHILCSIKHAEGSKPYYLFEQVHGRCPSCNQPIVRKDDEVAWKCVNPTCPARVEEKIVYATSKQALDIDGLGRAIIHALLKEGKIKTLADLFELSEDEICDTPLEGKLDVGIVGKKIYQQLQNALEKDLSCWITAFGIPGVGPVIARQVASKYKDFWDFVDHAKFVKNPDSVVECNIAEYLKDENNDARDLMAWGHNFTSKGCETGPFSGKTFVITGKFGMPRVEIEARIRHLGGTVTSSVSKGTTYLLQGEDKKESTKSRKAKQLGVVILDEETFNKMLNT